MSLPSLGVAQLTDRKWWAAILGTLSTFFILTGAASGGVARTQTLQLAEGWNAVFLEVEPDRPSPADVFQGTPVDIVAAYYHSSGSLQYISEPSLANFKKTGWGVWYAPNRPDAFLSTLFAIEGQRAYLVHATAPATLAVQGSAIISPIVWRPNSYNLVGFGLVSQGAPTFGQFFAGSPAHHPSKIYRMIGGTWRQVTQPAATPMRSGEAFWIHCKGPSTYQGPLEAVTRSSRGLLLTDGKGTLGLNNRSGHPLAVSVEHVPGGADAVPLNFEARLTDGGNGGLEVVALPLAGGAWTLDLPVIETKGRSGIHFRSRRESMMLPYHTSLLKITTDLGTVSWVPVGASREDLDTATP